MNDWTVCNLECVKEMDVVGFGELAVCGEGLLSYDPLYPHSPRLSSGTVLR